MNSLDSLAQSSSEGILFSALSAEIRVHPWLLTAWVRLGVSPLHVAAVREWFWSKQQTVKLWPGHRRVLEISRPRQKGGGDASSLL
jgi:hypothetical protein